jgi:cell surface protein SprA
MDPFVDNPTDEGGDLYINLGDISEDILKDSRKSFENGLPNSPVVKNVDTTAWGRVPTIQSVVNAFDNAPSSRLYQRLPSEISPHHGSCFLPGDFQGPVRG